MPSMRSDSPTLKALLLGLPLVALLPGCPVYWGPGDRTCTDDPECGPGGMCIDGSCVDPVCDEDADCGGGRLCIDFTCVDGPTTCRTHGDCAVGSYCLEDVSADECTPSGVCSTDGDCEAGFWCDYRGTCVPRDPSECRTSADCTGGALCIENRCEAVDDTCQFNRDCAPGSACVDNQCTAICTGDSDCEAGDTCVNSFCRPTEDCTTSAMCGAGEHCVNARCLPDCEGSPASCDTGSYCGPDDFCRPDWEPTPFCTVDGDCDQTVPRACIMGSCRTLCDDFASDCMTVDSQFTSCGTDDLSAGRDVCLAPSDTDPECRVAADCSGTDACINAICR